MRRLAPLLFCAPSNMASLQPGLTGGRRKVIEDRIRGALWGLISGDALSAPTHWYYGGSAQVRRDYGPQGITGYVKPVERLPGCIMAKSNVSGGGRGSWKPLSTTGGKPTSVIGEVINHGKLGYWEPGKDYHYHATLAAGEETLEASLARLLVRSITATGGVFDADHFRDA